MSPAPVIPKSLGGGFAPRIVCDKCRDCLAATVERAVSQNSILRAAASRYASPVSNEEKTAETVREESLVLPIEEFYEDDSRETYRQCGCEFIRQVFGQEIVTLEACNSQRDVDPRLVFKIALEMLDAWDLANDEWLSDRLPRLYSVKDGDNGERISFADELGSLVTSNTERGFQQYRNPEDIPFRRYHYAVLRLSNDGNLYFELTLFGVVRCLFLLGKCDDPSDRLLSVLERCVMFSIDNEQVECGCYPNVPCKRMTVWSDAAMDWRYWQLAKDERYKGML